MKYYIGTPKKFTYINATVAYMFSRGTVPKGGPHRLFPVLGT